MPIKTIVQTTTIITLIGLLHGCTTKISENQSGYYQDGIYFGEGLSKSYVRGVRDGCQTAKGKYTKSHWFFQKKHEYVEGWFIGRNKCRKLLKLDKNGELILPEDMGVSTKNPPLEDF